MSDLKNEIKMIGMLSVVYGLIPVLFTLFFGFDSIIYIPGIISAGIGVFFLVIGIRILTSKRMIAKKALFICDIINLIISIILMISAKSNLERIATYYMAQGFRFSDIMMLIAAIISIAVGSFLLFKIIKYNQAYEKSFSTGFQYDYPAGSQEEKQGFSYAEASNQDVSNSSDNKKAPEKAPPKKQKGKMVCCKCGKVNESDFLFCGYCGNNSFKPADN